jgi:NADH-quinone oxidoreductase subunit L
VGPQILIAIVSLPLAAALIAGLFGRVIGRGGAHWATCGAVFASFVLSCLVLRHLLVGDVGSIHQSVYTWLVSDGVRMEVGFLVDRLTALMMVVVTFVSFCVHVYTIGYMAEDPGYTRFFSYISLFTFSMLMLVMANNFLQLFFGWEAVGVVSYLLIGFWYTRPSATFASLKAFLVNRVGDFGFIIGIAAILFYTGSLDYQAVFAQAPAIAQRTIEVHAGHPWSAMSFICICLFIGAMGKSAQMPLHVWLPDSMEGPTPISALIHAATMVTAGIFMLARMSPLFEYSTTALSVVIVIGATTAFFTGLLGLVSNDIKRVIAYSTLSQLGYMTVACGASAYSIGIFHLMTHAFFKALLFLAAGSVIIALHHEQDLRKMGGLRKYLPVTYWTCLIGALALIGTPGFSGFFSKDALIEAVHAAKIPGAGYAYYCVLIGVFVTALYTFRLIFMTFHGPERFSLTSHDHASSADHDHDHDHDHHQGRAAGRPQESPAVVTVPLVLLAIPSLLIGWFTIGPILLGGYFGSALFTLEAHDVLGELAREWQGPAAFIAQAFTGLPVYLAGAGVLTAWLFFLKNPAWADGAQRRFARLWKLLVNKYYFDWLYEQIVARLGRGLGWALWKAGDEVLIDGVGVNGSARSIGWFATVVRQLQSGYLYHYAFAMIIGLSALLAWLLLKS